MFKDLWKRRAELVEKNLLIELENTAVINEKLFESMKYSLMSGGTRLRPVLLMSAADSCGVNGEKFLAMDNDDYRRGKLTNHKVFGEATAILAGDALLTLAFEIITRQKYVAPEILLQVVREFSIAAGAAGMVGGQEIDLESENKKIDLDTLKKMHLSKTGALFKAAICSGAILANADSTTS